MEVDRLFRDICEELADQDTSDTVANLWDGNNYNIQLTERSIEAVVDYYDYLNKFECAQLREAEKGVAVNAVPATTVAPAEKTPFEKAIDDKIAEYLQSAEGQSLIENKVKELLNQQTSVQPSISAPSATPTVNADNGAFDADTCIRELENVQLYMVGARGLPDRDSENYCERLAYAFLETYKLVGKKALLDAISEFEGDDVVAEKKHEGLSDQLKELLKLLSENYDKATGNVPGMYRYLMTK